MNIRFQRVAGVVMLIAVVGISVLLLRRSHRSQDSTPVLRISSGRDAQRKPPLPWTGTVIAVIDGDTIEVDHDGIARRVRIYGVDCPEAGQPFAEEAREFTASMVAGTDVTLTPTELDRLGRTVADVTLADGDSVRHLNRELLQDGLAWWYRAECPEAHDLESLEAEAREAECGLWGDPDSTPPWQYRELTQRAKSPDGGPEGPSTPLH